MIQRSEANILYDTVIRNGYCIGCGNCAAVSNSSFKVELNRYGNYVAVAINNNLQNDTNKYLSICPFSGESTNEDEINEKIFYKNPNRSTDLGNYYECYAGYVKENKFRELGSSGGFGKWMGYVLLKAGLVDFVIQVQPNGIGKNQDDPLFVYKKFESCEDIIEGSKSAYYPNTLVDVLKTIREKEGRYLVTGVPCFVKALRLMSINDKCIKDRLVYTMGIICGGMKSANQAKMIGWQLGVHPKHLIGIDFRRKHKDQPASQKIYQVWSGVDNKERYKDSTEIYGTDYGAGFFKPKACDFCDDMVGETADISVGDAWIKKYSKDPKGNSLLIVRNEELNGVLIKALADGDIQIDKISGDDACDAQAGGFRHRREGLSRRLLKKEQNAEWYPRKRVKPGQFDLNDKRKRIYDLREKIANASHEAFFEALDKDNLDLFYKKMDPLNKEYKSLNKISFTRSILRKVKRFVIYKVLKSY